MNPSGDRRPGDSEMHWCCCYNKRQSTILLMDCETLRSHYISIYLQGLMCFSGRLETRPEPQTSFTPLYSDLYIHYIMNEAGATVVLRGRGSEHHDSFKGSTIATPPFLSLKYQSIKSGSCQDLTRKLFEQFPLDMMLQGSIVCLQGTVTHSGDMLKYGNYQKLGSGFGTRTSINFICLRHSQVLVSTTEEDVNCSSD
ncbi:hypothetical protein OPV22_009843 [Ensete ventricosum]|uniref:Uncharacterized protein n=1 Tax=Ensete ventricosum TaxID=4639 RepID=A0AAV8R9T2_ENSVE|nr:hypothetical protein OPV22_009843 [Ensete ventricosum]